MEFQIIGPVREQRTIAEGGRIRDLSSLVRQYGQGRWRKRKGVALVRLHDGTIRHAEIRRMRRGKSRFVICIDNRKYRGSLERYKVYRAVDDAEGSRHGLIRVFDESGEGYLYSRDRFVEITLPSRARKALAASAR